MVIMKWLLLKDHDGKAKLLEIKYVIISNIKSSLFMDFSYFSTGQMMLHLFINEFLHFHAP